MARNRVIYQSEALYVSKSDATDGCRINQGTNGLAGGSTVTAADKPKYLQRVQNANYSFSIERQDVNQFGNLAAIDRIILSSPTVSLDFQYLVGNLANEARLGMHIVDNGATLESAIKNILDKTGDEKCYYIKTVGEGLDERDQAQHAGSFVIGIGNGYITSYSTEGSVGNFPTVSVNVEALNMQMYAKNSGTVPAVDPATGASETGKFFMLPHTSGDAINDRHAKASHADPSGAEAAQISVLRPGDISFEFLYSIDGGGQYYAYGAESGSNIQSGKHGIANISQASGDSGKAAKLQSYNISFDISRTPLEKLGSKFAFSREIDFPVTVSMSIEGSVSDLAVVSNVPSSLGNLVDQDGIFHLKVILTNPDPASSVAVCTYHLKGAKLDSQEFSSGIGDNKSVTFNFSTQIGGPEDTLSGFYLEGEEDSYEL